MADAMAQRSMNVVGITMILVALVWVSSIPVVPEIRIISVPLNLVISSVQVREEATFHPFYSP